MKIILILLIAVFTAAAQYPDTILGSISVGQNPTDVCISPDGNTAYVAVGFGFATVVDISEYANYSIITLVNIDGEPAAIECNSTGELVFVADSENNLLHVIETSDFTITKTLEIQPDPTDMIRYPLGNKIYLCHGNGMITVINSETQLIEDCYGAGNDLNSLCINSEESYIVAADNQSPQEVLIDPASGIASSFSSGSDNFGCSFSGNSEFLFLSNPGWNTISVINSSSFSVETTISCPDITPERMTSIPSLPYLYGVCPEDNKLLVVNTDDFSIEGEIVLPGEPVSIVAHPDGQRLFMACLADNKLKAIGFDPAGIHSNSQNFSAVVVNSPAESPSISITADVSGTCILKVFDLSGRVLQTDEISIGRNETVMYSLVSNLRGIQVLSITMNGISKSLKVIAL